MNEKIEGWVAEVVSGHGVDPLDITIAHHVALKVLEAAMDHNRFPDEQYVWIGNAISDLRASDKVEK